MDLGAMDLTVDPDERQDQGQQALQSCCRQSA
jgi:hypothetical protein